MMTERRWSLPKYQFKFINQPRPKDVRHSDRNPLPVRDRKLVDEVLTNGDCLFGSRERTSFSFQGNERCGGIQTNKVFEFTFVGSSLLLLRLTSGGWFEVDDRMCCGAWRVGRLNRPRYWFIAKKAIATSAATMIASTSTAMYKESGISSRRSSGASASSSACQLGGRERAAATARSEASRGF